MTDWIPVAEAAIPGHRAPMRLARRGEGEFGIFVGPTGLMTNSAPGSERALATLGCAPLRSRPAPRVLIGGLGMGFTLRAALDALPPDAQVVVAEIVPAVAEWARGPLAPVLGDSLDDPRVELRIEDVHRVIQSGRGVFDAILLDVDNGPQALTRRANDNLYDRWGLKRARYALRPDGVLAVWSGAPDRRFKARLRLCGFAVEERRVHANGRDGRRHVLWLATRPAEGGW